jgi:NADH:ubiquinone oxidoreductase subunit F (NADH-binding)
MGRIGTKMGTEKSPGVKIVCMSGHVEKPGNYEVEMGVRPWQLIEMAGGMRGGKKFKALLPSGGSGPVITEQALDAPMTYEGLTSYGSVMGSASVIVMDETTDMVWAALKMSHFFKHESCGKCTPCREGTFWMERLLHRIYDGHGTEQDCKRWKAWRTRLVAARCVRWVILQLIRFSRRSSIFRKSTGRKCRARRMTGKKTGGENGRSYPIKLNDEKSVRMGVGD